MTSTSNSTPALNTDRVRVAGFLKRKEGLSKEEFSRRWLEHGALFKTLDISKNIIHYDQLHPNDETTQMLQQLGASTTDWDGITITEAKSFADILGILKSEEYEKILAPDEETFLDRSKMQVMPLNFAVIIDQKNT